MKERYKKEKWNAYVVPNTIDMDNESKQCAIFSDTGICLGVIVEVTSKDILFLSSEDKNQLMAGYILGDI